jgi:hypothetical protein
MHKSWFYCVDSFIVAVIPNPPAGVESFDDDDDDDLVKNGFLTGKEWFFSFCPYKISFGIAEV